MSDSASVGVERVNESQIQKVREKHGERNLVNKWGNNRVDDVCR